MEFLKNLKRQRIEKPVLVDVIPITSYPSFCGEMPHVRMGILLESLGMGAWMVTCAA